jgi:hypothetical protein
VVPAVITWQGPRAGIFPNIGTDPANWLGGVVPSAGDDVIVPANTGGIWWNNITLGSVTIEAGWNEEWRTDGLTITGDSVMNDATFLLQDNPFVIAAGATLSGAKVTFQNDGQWPSPGVQIEATGAINLAPGKAFGFAVDVDNLGTITLGDRAGITLFGSSTLRNRFQLNFTGEARITGSDGTVNNSGFIQQLGTGFSTVEFEPFVSNSWLIATGGALGSSYRFNSLTGEESLLNSGILRVLDGTSMYTSALRSNGGEIQTIARGNGPELGATLYGSLYLNSTLIQIGYNSDSGKDSLRFGDAATLSDCTVNTVLNYTNDSMTLLSGNWISLDGSNTLNIRQVNRPAVLPAFPHVWGAAQATQTLTGDFTGWGIADLTHSKLERTIFLSVPAPAPVAADDWIAAVVGGPTVAPVLANDTGAYPLTVTEVTQGANGTVDLIDGVVTYTPNSLFTGRDTFTYTISDGHGGTDSATVTVGLDNHDPDVVNNPLSGTVHAGNAVTLGPSISDPDGDSYTVAITQQPSAGALSYDPGTGEFTYSAPNVITGGSLVVSFSFTVTDAFGAQAGGTGTITVTNSAPTAADISATIHAGDGITVYPAWMDEEGDAVTVASFTQGSHGTVAVGPGGHGLTYAASDPTYTGTDTFTYTIDDGHGAGASESFQLAA